MCVWQIDRQKYRQLVEAKWQRKGIFQQEQEEEEGADAFHAQTKQEVLESPWQSKQNTGLNLAILPNISGRSLGQNACAKVNVSSQDSACFSMFRITDAIVKQCNKIHEYSFFSYLNIESTPFVTIFIIRFGLKHWYFNFQYFLNRSTLSSFSLMNEEPPMQFAFPWKTTGIFGTPGPYFGSWPFCRNFKGTTLCGKSGGN